MNKGLTVRELLRACQEQVSKGNGDKHILLCDDDEGNGYHTLFYLFDDDQGSIEYALTIEHDNHTSDEVVLLG